MHPHAATHIAVTAKRRASTGTLFIVAGLAAALTAATAIAGPRWVAGDAMAPPTAAELGLSVDHAKQWNILRSETMALRKTDREDLISGITEFRSLLDQPTPDLRAFTHESQHTFDAHIAESRALRERQLDFYDSLTAAEQAKVRAAMAKRLDRLSQLRQRLAGLFQAQS